MNVVLIGFRGTGKSHVATILSNHLKMPVVSLDKEIERETGKTISEIVEQYGWNHFRNLESQLVQQYAIKDNLIIDTGGGVILRNENIDALRANGRIIWLRASPETIVRRIKKSTDRPALKEGTSFLDEVHEVLDERIALYEAAAEFTVDTDRSTPGEVANQIVHLQLI